MQKEVQYHLLLCNLQTGENASVDGASMEQKQK